MVDIKNFKISSCTSLLTSNIEYGDIMIGFFSILQFFPGNILIVSVRIHVQCTHKII